MFQILVDNKNIMVSVKRVYANKIRITTPSTLYTLLMHGVIYKLPPELPNTPTPPLVVKITGYTSRTLD